ncbi:hypothetical protein D3C74_414990 [compost metagenome]
MFTGTGSFNGCIQCQKIGLLGNIVNNLDDIADFAGVLFQLCHLVIHGLHSLQRGFHHITAFTCCSYRVIGQLGSFLRTYCH